jgi:capsular polysaccharide biosynthesis protein
VDEDGFLPLIRRWALLLAAAGVIAGAVGFVAASRIPPTYEARARLLVGPVNTDFETLRASSVLTRTYAELVTSEQVVDKAASTLGPAAGAEELRRSVDANANDVTRILTIRGTSRDPALAARIVQAVAQELVLVTSGTAEAPAPPTGTVTFVDPARVPTSPVGPDTRVHVALSMLAGVLAAMAIAFVIEVFGRGHLSAARLRRAGPVVVASAAGGEVAGTEPSGLPSRRRVRA